MYRAIGLNIRRRAKRRLPECVKQPLTIPTALNQISLIVPIVIETMSDSLANDFKFRMLNIIDDFNVNLWPLKQVFRCHH